MFVVDLAGDDEPHPGGEQGRSCDHSEEEVSVGGAGHHGLTVRLAGQCGTNHRHEEARLHQLQQLGGDLDWGHLEDRAAELQTGDDVLQSGNVLAVTGLQSVPAGTVHHQAPREGGVKAGETGGEDGTEVAVLGDVGLHVEMLAGERHAQHQGVPGQLALAVGSVQEWSEQGKQQEPRLTGAAGGRGGGRGEEVQQVGVLHQ